VGEITRRLAAIAFADVAGWSRLIEQSDIDTLRAWKAVRAELIEPKIAANGGRLLEIAGDSVLVEFPSAVDAVNWAVEVQRGMRDSHAGYHLAMRIGINVEDVIVDDDKLVGTGVNVASRIQQLAAPGEIIVTNAVHDYVVNKLPITFTDLGKQKLKNISRRVHLYHIHAEGLAPQADDAQTAEVRGATLAYLDSVAERTVRAVLDVEMAEADHSLGRSQEEIISHRRTLVDRVATNVLPAYGGRILKSLGQGLVVDFAHASVALKAAFSIQRSCAELNAGLKPDRQTLVRMGIQVGELISDDHGVYGRDLNLVSRLTDISGPAEIVVSADVRDQIVPMLDADIEDLGECYLKNLEHPIRAYRVGPPGPRPVIERGGTTEDLRPTVAVIPFAARTADARHLVLGEVLAEEVISALSRTSEINVISRLSTTAFRGRQATLDEVGAHLNANYILSGTYRVAGKGFSLTAELAEAKTGRIVCITESKGDIGDVLGGHDDVIDRLVTEISSAITIRELQRAQNQALPTLEGYTLLIAAISLMHRLSSTDYQRAEEMLRNLIDRSPRRAIPHAWLGKWHVLRVWQGWSSDPAKDARLALDCTKRALENDAHCSLALVIDGLVHMNLLKDLNIAKQRFDVALQVNPNDSLGWLLRGTMHAFKGEGAPAMQHTGRARRLSPLDPLRYYYDSLSATAALAAHKYERAVELARRSMRANRTHASTLRALAIAEWELGRHEDARTTVAELMRLEPGLTITNYLERSPSSAYETGKIWSNALRNAGVPH
jgi:class 3 adenylate cyclase/tetratricopeptide (TPR) repeat protein